MGEIHCQSLCKNYLQGDKVIRALDDVTLHIPNGSLVCLSGPSGSGKTTLLNAIGGLDRVDSGEISIDGRRIEALSKGQLADLRLHTIGFVFQAYNLIPVLSARENVEFVMQMQGITATELRDRSTSILAEVGLAGMEDRRPAELSGGQQQRVAVARALVSQPKLILADEPTANLDTASMRALMEKFVALNQKHACTFVIATHDMRVLEYARRQVILRDGQIAADESR